MLKKNINTKKLNNKLNYKKLKLYKIKKVKKLLNYKLNLFKSINIHLVFYVFLLEKKLLNVLLVLKTESFLVNSNAEYKVKQILSYKYVKTVVKYFIK